MAINNFKPFALDPNANVTSQADWEALPALLSGFTAGKASSAQVNKAIRQASFIAAALAQYTANKSGLDVLDDGDLNGFISKMGTAFGKDFQALDATLTALAGLATGENKLPYFTGNDTAAQTDLTSVGRDIIGKSTIADILTYLGLGEGSALPVGVPVPWPSATPPTGWLKCNGAAFSAEEYPELAKAYPTNKLPDLRGEFIRGWDDGRNVDAGRALLSQQGDAMQKISGTVADNAMGASASGSGAMTIIGASGTTYYASAAASSSYIYYKTIGIDSSLVARTANENRPRNIAFNYIVRAA
ncbi:tail fiber protein [Escherichia coli]|uniref:tail fiber protein n=3 Tax=Escherichia coli TaxID=562 RepID=UPI000CAC4DEB|nr:tail fiber protein [Escherichia coli]EHK7639516.1 tail fiber protein [Escherichia coli]OZO70890.1 phage tail protein [Escherichia coli]HBK0831559.1 tail fiber protein [Escherichia coli]